MQTIFFVNVLYFERETLMLWLFSRLLFGVFGRMYDSLHPEWVACCFLFGVWFIEFLLFILLLLCSRTVAMWVRSGFYVVRA